MTSNLNIRPPKNKRERATNTLVSAVTAIKHHTHTLDMQNPGQWTAVVKMVFLTMVLLAVFVLLWLLLINGQVTELKTARSQQQVLMQEYQQKIAQLSHIDALRKQLNQQRRQQALQLNKISEESNVAQQIEWLTVLASKTNIDIKDIALQGLVEQGDYIQQPVSMQVSGKYGNISEFLAGLQTLPTLVVIHDFELKSGADFSKNDVTNPNLQFGILLTTYVVDSATPNSKPEKKQDFFGETAGIATTVIEPKTQPITQPLDNQRNSQFAPEGGQVGDNTVGLAAQADIFATISNPFAIPQQLLSLLSHNTQSKTLSASSQLKTEITPTTSVAPINKDTPTSTQATISTQATPMVNPQTANHPLVPHGLSSLHFKGMVVAPSGITFALLEQSDGRVLQVKKGDHIGRDLMENSLGKVVAITANQLTLEETIVREGKQVTKQRVLSIAQ